jgi:hypothetical protein
MYKSMLNAMMLNASSTVGKVTETNNPNRRIDVPKGGGGLYIFNGTNNINIGGSDDNSDDTSWLLG